MNTVAEGQVIEREVPTSQAVDAATSGLVARAEIDMQIATANKYPRSVKVSINTALELACLNEHTAAECIYALPRDGKVIEGPSARFAEIMAYSWKNCRAGARIVDESAEFITAQGVFHDLQQNVAITYEVQRRITDKRGKRYKADMIGVTGNAASSIALRNAVLKGIPKAIWMQIYQSARQVVAGDVKTLATRRAAVIASFQIYGITPEQICATLGVKGVEDIGLDQLVVLRGIYTAIKEGDTTPEQAFATTDGERSPIAGPKTKPPTPEGEQQKPPQGEPAGQQAATGDVSGHVGAAAATAAPAAQPTNEKPTEPTAAELAQKVDAQRNAQAAITQRPADYKRAAGGLIRVLKAKIAGGVASRGAEAVTEAAICQRYKIEKIEDLPAEDYNAVTEWVTGKKLGAE